MIWRLLLAHVLGDFVFQTDRMVKYRDTYWILIIHAFIHFVLMVILVGQQRLEFWPYLLLVATQHLIQDRVKNNITNTRPDWIGMGFIIDQVMHFIVIWAAVESFQMTTELISGTDEPVWIIISLAYVSVTFVWFVIERIINTSNLEYLQDLNNTKFSRMLSRAGLISVYLLIWNLATAGLSFFISNPYPRSKFRQRAVFTDVSVSLLAIIFLFWALK
jgi:hypothetical protein